MKDHERRLGLELSLICLFASCGGGSGSNGGTDGQACPDLSGTWNVTSIDDDTKCGGRISTNVWLAVVTQNGCAFTMTNDSEIVTGTLSGNRITASSTSTGQDGVATGKISGTVSGDGTSIAGSDSWTYQASAKSCDGTSQLAAYREHLLLVDVSVQSDVPMPDIVTLTASQNGATLKQSTVPWLASNAGSLNVALGLPSDITGTVVVNGVASRSGLPVGQGSVTATGIVTGKDNGPFSLVLQPVAGGGDDGGTGGEAPDTGKATSTDARAATDAGLALADASSADSTPDADAAPTTTLCVGTAEELTAALATAESALGPVVIDLVAGTYTGNFIYYASTPRALTLVGGFAPGCAADAGAGADGGASAGADAGSGATILDGAANGAVLSLQSPKAHDFTLRNLTLRNGSNLQHEGGGLRVVTSGSLTVEDSVITANVAATGGGIYASGVASLTVTGTTVSNNLFLGYSDNGGGICALDVKRVTVKGSTITGNLRQSGNVYSLGSGGGLYVGSSFGSSSDLPPVRAEECVITGNQAGQGAGVTVGGDVFFGKPNTIDIVNCVIANNVADGLGGTVGSTGGGLYLYGSVVSLTNNTITGNIGSTSAGGARITLPASTDSATLVNNIIWGNQTSATDGSVSDLYIDNGDTDRARVTFLGNDFPQASTAYYATIPVSIGAGNMNGVAPAFVSAAAGDYSLASGSPCVDKGVDAASGGATVDLIGVARPLGLGTDIGAYESH